MTERSSYTVENVDFVVSTSVDVGSGLYRDD